MKKNIGSRFILFLSSLCLLVACETLEQQDNIRLVEDFNFDWSFSLGDFPKAIDSTFDASNWRRLHLPHDWSIEGAFSKDHPAKPEGGALPTGIAWYRKTFKVPLNDQNKMVRVEFGGVYRKSDVWINGHHLGQRPNGYITFAYDLSPYLNYGNTSNVIAVKVDNSEQPNSRWYSGSGIYRNVKLVVTEKLHVAQWGTYVTTPQVSKEKATVNLEVTLQNNTNSEQQYTVESTILDAESKVVAQSTSEEKITGKQLKTQQQFEILNPNLWDTENPYLYKIETRVYQRNVLVDNYETPLGIRYFNFDAEKGFSLNGIPTKILGVCLHHDNGALGAVANKSAIKRKLRIMKDMGANAIRVSHNPSSVALLELCDEMGFIVQVEAFDVWKKKKVKADYNLYWDDWHKQDLEDFVKRDRNYPSVMMWSIGNEIREQFDSTGVTITKTLVDIVKNLDKTRPVTCALTENVPEKNFIYQSGALDLLGFNYKHNDYYHFPETFIDEKIIASESVSALATRGHYDMPSDIIKRWPSAHNKPFDGNTDYTVSAYDQISAYWGATHEENWKTVKALDYIAGQFIWTGFDYLGEPIPYPYPARSSYFGVVDLAGLPKDVYYMYQSEWSNEDVLHVFPHWNWEEDQEVDVWVYYNHADEVELFLNEESLGVKSKQNDDLHVSWRVPFKPGTLKAVSRKNEKVVLQKEVRSSMTPVQLRLVSDKQFIADNHYDLAYVTVNVLDENETLVSMANNLITFSIMGGGNIVGVDNGYQANLSSFKTSKIKAYNGKCVVIIQTNNEAEDVVLTATAEGMAPAKIKIQKKK